MHTYHFVLLYLHNNETLEIEISAIDRDNAWQSLVSERHGPGHSRIDMSNVVSVSLDMDTEE